MGTHDLGELLLWLGAGAAVGVGGWLAVLALQRLSDTKRRR